MTGPWSGWTLPIKRDPPALTSEPEAANLGQRLGICMYYVGSRKEPSDSSKGKIINQDKKIANLDFFTLIKRILVIKSEICTLKLYATGVYFLLYFSRFGSQQLAPGLTSEWSINDDEMMTLFSTYLEN